MKTELDSLEAQIEQVNQVNAGKTKMTAELVAKNDSLKTKIKVLRGELAKGRLTKAELEKAQDDIKQLRFSVTNYSAEIEELKKQNVALATERDTLKKTLKVASQKIPIFRSKTRTWALKLKSVRL